jgi:hypothetical protein
VVKEEEVFNMQSVVEASRVGFRIGLSMLPSSASWIVILLPPLGPQSRSFRLFSLFMLLLASRQISLRRFLMVILFFDFVTREREGMRWSPRAERATNGNSRMTLHRARPPAPPRATRPFARRGFVFSEVVTIEIALERGCCRCCGETLSPLAALQ